MNRRVRTLKDFNNANRFQVRRQRSQNEQKRRRVARFAFGNVDGRRVRHNQFALFGLQNLLEQFRMLFERFFVFAKIRFLKIDLTLQRQSRAVRQSPNRPAVCSQRRNYASQKSAVELRRSHVRPRQLRNLCYQFANLLFRLLNQLRIERRRFHTHIGFPFRLLNIRKLIYYITLSV